MSSFRVADGTQLNVEGTVYAEGDVVELDDDVAQAWLDAGLIEKADAIDKPDKRYRRPK